MSLLTLLRSRWEACEADLRRFYGLSLTDIVFSEDCEGRPVSWRELWVLLKQLPEDSALKSLDGWTADHEMQALQVELTHALLVAVMGIGGVKKLPKPLHIPRPNEATGGSRRRRSPKGDRVIRTLEELRTLQHG